ncbi:hypothetical protein [Hydrogenophaga atypica]|uniref:Uncharacterized protein n=1 Tax=Hydrogenophaga atypica TaxID=249409 RepID=A0ABW2QRZ3_9BURK
MKAKWIAQALMANSSKEFLTLSKAELASWHLSGARVSNRSPYSNYGVYAVAHHGRLNIETQQKLLSMEVKDWPTGPYRDWTIQSSHYAHLPKLQATRVGQDTWAVPIIPDDPGHSLDGWSYDLGLAPGEMEALRPIAAILASRCLLTSYCKIIAQRDKHPIPWDDSRIQLAQLGGMTIAQLQAGFAVAKAKCSSIKAPCAPSNLAVLGAPLRLFHID